MHRERKLADEERAPPITDYLQYVEIPGKPDIVSSALQVRCTRTYKNWTRRSTPRSSSRLLTDTVLDFLVSKGVDTSAYRNYAQTVINSGVMISGSTLTNATVSAGAAAVSPPVTAPAGPGRGLTTATWPGRATGRRPSTRAVRTEMPCAQKWSIPMSPMSDGYGPPPGGAGPGAFHNSGVYISGSTVSGSAVAAGSGPIGQHVTSTPAADALAAIDRLLEELKNGATELDAEQAEAVVDDADRLSGEIRHRRPDRDSVLFLLSRLSQRVGGVAALLANVDRVRELVMALVH